jgi:hypothetical protein
MAELYSIPSSPAQPFTDDSLLHIPILADSPALCRRLRCVIYCFTIGSFRANGFLPIAIE